jgi:tRNA1Val (adenine37-N6)-methyltransferase
MLSNFGGIFAEICKNHDKIKPCKILKRGNKERMEISDVFRFKQFDIYQDKCTMKVNTDGVLLGAWSDINDRKRALDIGTGTGIIAMMLSQRNPSISVTAVEIDEEAYLQASFNMKQSVFADRLFAVNAALQDFVKNTTSQFDLIISNPPFFTGGTFSSNENKANVRHTIKLSHTDLLMSVKKMMTTDGYFDLILPYIEGLRFVEMADKYDMSLAKMTEVRSRENKGIERLLLRFKHGESPEFVKDELIIYQGTGVKDYSEEFKGMTREFYLFL